MATVPLHIFPSMFKELGPDRRTTPRPPGPGGVAIAQIVSMEDIGCTPASYRSQRDPVNPRRAIFDTTEPYGTRYPVVEIDQMVPGTRWFKKVEICANDGRQRA